MYKLWGKKVFDWIIAFIILLILSPILLIIALLIPLESKGPILFTQKRIGINLKEFTVYKFRTMTVEKREVGDQPIIGKAKGVTTLGYYLRRFKLDEFPQLINVLKGEMSLVGPRPSVEKQLAMMTPEEKQRYSVKSGLTGLAQVSGNIHLDWKERFRKDLLYIRNISFENDLRILIRTFFLIFRGEKYYKDRPLKIKIYS